MLADDELIVINHDRSRESEYISYKSYSFGKSTLGITLKDGINRSKIESSYIYGGCGSVS